MAETKEQQKILKAKCKHCGKEITSLYPKQLEWNLKSHEDSCKQNPKNKTKKSWNLGK